MAKKENFSPEQETQRVILLCKKQYSEVYSALETNFPNGLEGVELKNEISARKEGVQFLTWLVKEIASLEEMIQNGEYTHQSREYAYEAERLAESI